MKDASSDGQPRGGMPSPAHGAISTGPGHSSANLPDMQVVAPPPDMLEATLALFLRMFLRASFRTLIGPPLGVRDQRWIVNSLAPLMPCVPGNDISEVSAGPVRVEVVTPQRPDEQSVILYLHGGAFVLGSPATYRSLTTRLAAASGLPVWTPDYRLAPEHPYPAALDDAATVFDSLVARGIPARRIVLAGDSAGAALALALAIRLSKAGRETPAGLALISPVTDPALDETLVAANEWADPMVRLGWVEQGMRWYACPPEALEHRPLETSLAGLPPMLVQTGDQEIFFAGSMRLAQHAERCGVPCKLEVYAGRWHVFHLQAFYLASARTAIGALAGFARERVGAVPGRACGGLAPSERQPGRESRIR